MRIAIINGPNLNLLGKREPDIYGNRSFEDFFEEIQKDYPQISFTSFQSNKEGEIVSQIQEKGFEVEGILLNAAAYTHTSVAIRDAIAAVPAEVLEIHISNVHAREGFRHHSYIGAVCKGSICGLGLWGYRLGIDYFINLKKEYFSIQNKQD